MRMRFRECMSKNEGVAGYVEAFWHVLSESQTAHMYQLLIIQCTSVQISSYIQNQEHNPAYFTPPFLGKHKISPGNSLLHQ